MPLLERHGLLQQLESFLAEAARGNGRLVSLLGEAGVGKSALANALAVRAAGHCRVVWGACEDLSTPQPLGALYDLMRRGAWSIPPPQASSQIALFSAVLEELRAKPTLVVLEDLHWADDATLDLVRFLGRRIGGEPVLILITARNDETDARSRLRRALVNVAPESLTRIEVPRLSEAAVASLARKMGQDGAKVFALTGGNAFLTMEVLRSGDDCPANVRDALLLRADRLSPPARRTLEAAAIFPRRVEDWLLQAVSETSDPHSVAECVAAGLLIADQGYYAFPHEIARRAIERDMPAGVRAKLNKRALDVLRTRTQTPTPTPTARLVHHAVAAADAEAVCELAPRAAEEAARMGAHRQAASHYAAALSHAHILAPEQRAQLFERSAFELQLTGRVPEAIDAHKAALELRRQCGQEAAVGDALRWLSRLHYNIGDRETANAHGLAAIAVLEPLGPSPELAMAYANYALIKAIQDDHAAGVEWAEKTIELAGALNRPDIIADAHATLGAAKQWIDYEASHEHFQHALALSLQLDRVELTARIYSNASCIELNTRHASRAHAMMSAGLDYCTKRDLDTWTGYIRGWLAELHVREGSWQEARAEASMVIDEGGYSPLLRFPAVAALARLSIRTGTEDPAPLLSDLTFSNEPQRLLIYAPIFGEHAWVYDVGRDDALALLTEAAQVAAQVGNVWAAGEIAYWRGKLGEPARLQGGFAPPFSLLFSGDWRGASDAWAALPAPYDQALALLEGDEEACTQGLLLLESLGALAVADRARRDLRRRGVRRLARGPRPSTRSNFAGLTRRQMDVLKLIEKGRSNAEIAEALGISIKTIDHHVSAVLEKMSVSSRGEAAARARELGLTGG